MKKYIICLALATTLIQAQNFDVNQIMNQVKWREDGVSRAANVTLKIIDSSGNTRERIVDYIEKDIGKERYTILYVEKPKDVKKTTILLKNNSSQIGNTASNIWLYIPVLGKVKKLSNQNKSGRFVGSNFRYVDLEWITLEDYQYKFLGEEVLSDRNVYKIEAIAANDTIIEKDGYSKKILWIDVEYNIIVQSLYYNRDNFLIKKLSVKDIQKIDGYWTVIEQVIENYLDKQQTVMILDNVKYDISLPNNIFTKNKLGKKITW
ncbi:MAG TPA: outer membrane lipoprotein-sorting protein [Arcobacter sp.]|nr:outer membrane lipoprotein-sorting protein [Arcobacter sp.]